MQIVLPIPVEMVSYEVVTIGIADICLRKSPCCSSRCYRMDFGYRMFLDLSSLFSLEAHHVCGR